MKKNIYLRSTFTDIRHSLGRFIAIILIIFMGVMLFVGIKSIGPNLEQTANTYIKKTNLSDLQIVSTAGLTTKDKEIVEKINGANVELAYSFPYLDDWKQLNLQLYSYNSAQKQNKFTLLDGHIPKSSSEIVIDKTLQKEYSIGDTIKIDNNQLREKEYKVVGYVESPLYMNNEERGMTTIGDGEVDGFVYIPEDAFDSENYSIMYVTFDSLANKDFFSDSYENRIEKKVDKLDRLFDTRKIERKKELQDKANSELEVQEKTVAENETKLIDAQKALSDAKVQLETQKEQLTAQKEQVISQYGQSVADQQFAAAEEQIANTEKQLNEQQQTLIENQEKIKEAKEKIEAAKNDIKEMDTPNYIINTRDSSPGFSEYTSLSDRINAIGNVFPVFFFFVAILITFTTITRMIEENRKEIGTLKALGYFKHEIASKYILYALLTAFVGTLVGVIAGTKYLPPIVFSMLKKLYVFPSYTTNFWFVPIVIAIGAALVATLGSSFLVLSRNLNEKPAALLIPKAPKAGKRVLLERVTPIWSRLNFNQKVTYRNLFRYKARMILTILGIAGCTGLILAGFGLNYSVSAAAHKQFNEITHYQAIVTLDKDSDANKENKVKDILDTETNVKDYLPIYSEQVTFKEKNIANQTATLYVTNDTNRIKQFFTFHRETNDSKVKLGNDGAIISQRLAKIYDVKVGDRLTMQDAEGNKYKLKIAGIVENYLGHNVFMTEDYYRNVTSNHFVSNSYLVKTKNLTNNQEARLSQILRDTDEVQNTSFISTQIEKQDSQSRSLQPVVFIFIVLSGTLAFVVLYNLTNINISERERELATIKVLGFFDNEVTMYIVRENVIFTIFGILFGFGIGKMLTWFIITMASSDLVTFPLIIPWESYLISAAMTTVFSAIVMVVTHLKLKHINMIEALKSNE